MSRELYAMLLDIMNEFRSVPLSLSDMNIIKPLPTNLLFTSKSLLINIKTCVISTSNFNESCCYRYLPYRCSWPCYKCLSLLPSCARLNDRHCLAFNINLAFGFWLTSFRPRLGAKYTTPAFCPSPLGNICPGK